MRDYSLHTENQLFERIRLADKNAFAELFNRYWRRAYNIAWSKLRDKETTEEVVQEVFVHIWEKRETLSIGNFRSFLYACVKNRCLNHIESLMIHKKHRDHYMSFIPNVEDTTEKSVAYNELLEAISTGVETLPGKTQTIFRLNRLEGKSISEIANSLNLSEKAIEYHITRSLKQLRIHLKDFMVALVFVLFG